MILRWSLLILHTFVTLLSAQPVCSQPVIEIYHIWIEKTIQKSVWHCHWKWVWAFHTFPLYFSGVSCKSAIRKSQIPHMHKNVNLLRSKTEGYGCKTHYIGSEGSDTPVCTVVPASLGPSYDFGILDVLAYLGVALMNRKFVHDKIKRRLYSGNSCYCLVQNLLSSWFLS